MHKLEELKKALVTELEGYAGSDLSVNSLEVIDKLAHATKNLCKVIENCDEEEYSNYGRSRRAYDRDDGMDRRYSEENSYRRGRDSMGRFTSRADGMVEELRDLMKNAPTEETRAALREIVRKMEQM